MHVFMMSVYVCVRCVCVCVCVGLQKHSPDLAWDLNRLSETLLICTVKYNSPKPHVALELLKCG